MSFAARRAASWTVALALGIAVAGCGGSDDQPDRLGELDGQRPERPAPSEPVEAPPAKESIGEAQKRIAAAGDDCERLLELLPLGTPEQARTPERCETLRTATEGTLVGSGEYGGLAAVIDYEVAGGRFASLVLVRDADGLYHVAFVDRTPEAPASRTALERGQADEAMSRTLDAFATGDCDSLLEIKFQGFGPSAELDVDRVCASLSPGTEALAREAQAPKLIGGNGQYAFYGLSTPRGHYTFVFVRQKPHADLRGGAPTYGYHVRVLTNPAEESDPAEPSD